MSVSLNPVRLLLLWVGVALSRVGLIDESRARRVVDLAWPRVVTGLARMSKSAADVAMVGVVLGPAAITGVGFAGPYWGLAFSLGGGLAAGTIALVSQRFSAGAHDELGQAIRASALLAVAASLSVGVLFVLFPRFLISLITNGPETITYGADYLRVLGFGVPFAALNLVGSRALIGVDDAWTAMVARAGGAVVNIALNAVFIFGLGWGVVGAGLGTVIANVFVTAFFAVGLARGRLPGVGDFPVAVSPFGSYLHPGDLRDVFTIGLPVIGRNSVWTVARFPLLAFLYVIGPNVAAAYIVTRRIWGLLNTPGWGFGLAASSLVGQALGTGDEDTAARYGWEVAVFAVATYAVFAVPVILFARPIVVLFLGDPASPAIQYAVPLVYVAAVAIIPQGVTSGIAGALDATGDTRWPFYGRVLGMFCLAVPAAYLGATTTLGVLAIYFTFFAETVTPAIINTYRFRSGAWKAISRGYRPEQAAGD
ncbi:MATE family efflux transporter [Halocalculus aciditolerans]|uniref:Multidrug-efflux transporter n=1 Tax=Halocalculus aciditolerans TaxID=1383812 RepID=A0A830FIW6_9EURY|nr:MATE family efflux transporter [Halocalculus aciditolerans]GGL57203.1 DMT family permease [Halocalculus aciditolerans]